MFIFVIHRLLSSGRELITFYATNNEDDKWQRSDIKRKLDTIVDRWERIKNLYKIKSTKLHDLKMTMLRLEERIAQIRTWLHGIETELSKPLVFESTANSAFDKIIHENEKLQRSIEKESGNVGEVLNLCEMLLNDMNTWKAYIDTNSLSTAVESLDRRWKNICHASAERKQRIHSIWTLLLEVITLTTEQIPWIEKQENDLIDLEKNLKKLTTKQTEQRIQALENKIKEIEQRRPQFNNLSQTYSKLVKSNGIDPANIQELTNKSKNVLQRYNKLVPRALDIIGKLNIDMRKYREFMNLHGKSIIALSHIDGELTKLEHPTQPNAEENAKTLQILEQELKLCEPDLSLADNLGLDIMKRSTNNEIDSIQLLIDQYQLLWKEITSRITTIKLQLKEAEVVETFRSETDSAVQVNTLPNLNRTTSITPRDAYVHELAAALKECHENLNQLDVEVNNSQRKPGSQVVQKLISKCQSSVELVNHLSGILVTECFCTDEEAAVAEVNRIKSRYEALVALWKAKERQLENR